MNFFKPLVFILTSLILSGCLLLPALQSGKTVGENNVELSANGSYGKYSPNSVLDIEGDFDYKAVIGVRTHYGLTDKIDIGFDLDQTSFVGGSFKYQFLGDQNSKFATSVGVEGGFSFGAFLFGDFTNYLSTPLYISAHPSEYFAICLTPRYIHSSIYVFDHPTGGHWVRVRASILLLIPMDLFLVKNIKLPWKFLTTKVNFLNQVNFLLPI